jgi:hypothetical protein
MWATNAGLTDRHSYDSRPLSWPRLRRGIVSRLDTLNDLPWRAHWISELLGQGPSPDLLDRQPVCLVVELCLGRRLSPRSRIPYSTCEARVQGL